MVNKLLVSTRAKPDNAPSINNIINAPSINNINNCEYFIQENIFIRSLLDYKRYNIYRVKLLPEIINSNVDNVFFYYANNIKEGQARRVDNLLHIILNEKKNNNNSNNNIVKRNSYNILL